MGNGNTNAYADEFRNLGTRMSKGITAITVFKATQKIKSYPTTSVTYQTLFYPAILIDEMQVNFSTSFRIADLETEQASTEHGIEWRGTMDNDVKEFRPAGKH